MFDAAVVANYAALFVFAEHTTYRENFGCNVYAHARLSSQCGRVAMSGAAWLFAEDWGGCLITEPSKRERHQIPQSNNKASTSRAECFIASQHDCIGEMEMKNKTT